MIRHREDSIIGIAQKKTPEELAAENETLKQQVTSLQLALCEVYEAVTTTGAEVAK